MFCVLLRTTFATFNKFMKKSLPVFDFSKLLSRRLARKLFAISEMCKLRNVLFLTSFQMCFSCKLYVCTHHHLFAFARHENWMIFIIEFFWSFCCCFASCDAFQRRRIQLGFIQRRNDVTTPSYTDYWHRIPREGVNSSSYRPQNCIIGCGTQCELTEGTFHFLLYIQILIFWI